MLLKFATFATIEARMAPRRASTKTAMLRDAKRHEFQYTPRPGFLYVRSRAISSRTNDNFDTYPAEELRKAYKTFIGKPVFVNHHNDDPSRARGVIRDAVLHEHTAPDGTPDTWVEVLMEVDARRFPRLAKEILDGNIDRTSMGCNVMTSECSYCGKVATTPDSYCEHITNMKGKRLRRRAATGGVESVLVHEICRGLAFFENSLLVDEPADPTAFFLGVDDSGVRADASLYTAIMREGMVKAAAFRKSAANYVIVGGGPGSMWEMHIEGCSDIYKAKYDMSTKDTVEASSVQEAVSIFMDEQLQEQGWSTSDIRILPCARSGVPVEEKPLPEGVCPGTGQLFNNPQRRLRMNCPVCGLGVSAKSGKVPRHKPYVRKGSVKAAAFRPVAAKFYCQTCGYHGVTTAEGGLPKACPDCGADTGLARDDDDLKTTEAKTAMDVEEITYDEVRPGHSVIITREGNEWSWNLYVERAEDDWEGIDFDSGFSSLEEAKASVEDFLGYKISAKTAETHAPYHVRERDGKWVVVNDIDEVKGTHDTREEALEQQRALYANVPGASEQAERKSSKMAGWLDDDASEHCNAYITADGKGRWFCTEDPNHDGEHTHFGDPFPAGVEVKMAKTADYDEVRRDHPIETLRNQTCPVCKTKNAWDGNICTSCGYVLPPRPFRAPDTEVASRVSPDEGWFDPGAKKADPFDPVQTANSATKRQTVQGDETMGTPSIAAAARQRHAARQAEAARVARLRRMAAEDGTGTITEDEVPPAETAAETTEETLNEPDAQNVDVETPGGVVEAPAPDATTDVTTPGGVIEAPAPDDVQDPEKPVAGAETVDPAASDDNAWTEDNSAEGAPDAPINASDWNTASRRRAAAQPGVITREAAQKIAEVTRDRIFSSLRLARLRIAANIADESDDLKLARTIEASNTSNEAIATEIQALAKVVQNRPAQVVQQRQATRRAPSLGGGLPSMTAVSQGGGFGSDDDTALFEP